MPCQTCRSRFDVPSQRFLGKLKTTAAPTIAGELIFELAPSGIRLLQIAFDLEDERRQSGVLQVVHDSTQLGGSAPGTDGQLTG